MRLRVFALSLLFAPCTAWAAPSSLEVKSTSIEWISDAPVEKIVGTADGKGSLQIDFADLSTITGSFSVAVNSMKTGNDKRDQHLQGPQWLDGTQFPDITYTIKSVKVTEAPKGDAIKTAALEATGVFSIRGKTKPVTAKVNLKWKGAKVKMKATFEVSLDDFAIEGKKGIVGNKVGKTIGITAAFKGKAN